jgi:short-subunit dehydrogenase
LAVVTGAAGGLGLAFANQLAERGYHLLLVDRREAELERACAAIEARHRVSADSWVADLCLRADVQRLAHHLQQAADVELLVNNAGFGAVDYFVDTHADYLVGMADLHVIAPTVLTRAVVPKMIERNSGAIINVSSLSAWFHSAGNVQYAATKSYLAIFSAALDQELRGTNVFVQALCPGFIRTGFHQQECMQAFRLRKAPAEHLWMTAEEVVNCSLRKLGKRQVIVVPGLGYSILGRLARMPLLQPLAQWLARSPARVAAPAMPSDDNRLLDSISASPTNS